MVVAYVRSSWSQEVLNIRACGSEIAMRTICDCHLTTLSLLVLTVELLVYLNRLALEHTVRNLDTNGVYVEIVFTDELR